MADTAATVPYRTSKARGSSVTSWWVRCIVPFTIAILCGGLCYIAAGATLGFFLGTCLLLTIAGPPLWSGRDWKDAVVEVGAMWIATAGVWIVAATLPGVFLGDVARCLPVLGAYLAALAAGHALLVRCGLPKTVAAGIITTKGLLWLSWPVWLCAALEGPHGQTIVSTLTPVDPLITINGVMRHFGAWDHVAPLAYNVLTVLNQDVTYRLPDSALPSVLLHGGVAATYFGLSRLLRNRVESSLSNPQPATAVR